MKVGTILGSIVIGVCCFLILVLVLGLRADVLPNEPIFWGAAAPSAFVTLLSLFFLSWRDKANDRKNAKMRRAKE